MYIEPAPIALFTYKRLSTLKKTIESLIQNEFADKSELFVFSDGPKDDKDYGQVMEVRKFLKTISGFKRVEIIERERNVGLAENIEDGISQVVNQYGKVIVLEDDLVASPYFLKFMNLGLTIYENVEKVMCISGYSYPIRKEGLPDTYFLQDGQTWGWATWKRAWRFYERNPEKLIKTFDKEMIRRFDFNNSGQYWIQVELNYKGKLKTWGIFWTAAIFLNNGLTLFPRDSLVQHIGKGGTHFGYSDVFDVELSQKSEWTFPEQVEENKLARHRVEEFLNSLKPPLWRRVLSKVVPDSMVFKRFTFKVTVRR